MTLRFKYYARGGNKEVYRMFRGEVEQHMACFVGFDEWKMYDSIAAYLRTRGTVMFRIPQCVRVPADAEGPGEEKCDAYCELINWTECCKWRLAPPSDPPIPIHFRYSILPGAQTNFKAIRETETGRVCCPQHADKIREGIQHWDRMCQELGLQYHEVEFFWDSSEHKVCFFDFDKVELNPNAAQQHNRVGAWLKRKVGSEGDQKTRVLKRKVGSKDDEKAKRGRKD